MDPHHPALTSTQTWPTTRPWLPEGVGPPDAWHADREDRGWTPGLGWLDIYPALGGHVLLWEHT